MWVDKEDRVICVNCANWFDYTIYRDRLTRMSTRAGGKWLCEDCTPKHNWHEIQRCIVPGRKPPNLKTVGNIYFILAPEVNRVKIGFAQNLQGRLAALQTGSPVNMEIIASIANKTIADERFLHIMFDDYRFKGEWFEFSEEIKEYLREQDDIYIAERYNIYLKN